MPSDNPQLELTFNGFYGDSGVQRHETHTVTDSTKLSTYMECPRKYFYQYMLGWQFTIPNVHLHGGSAMHLAWERLIWLNARDGGYRPEHVDEAFQLFEVEYRKFFNPEDDHLRAPKNPDGVRWALEEYIKQYRNDHFEPLWTEIAGRVPLDESGEMWIHFKMDAILRDLDEASRIVIMDHKTTKAGYLNNDWGTKWALTVQFFTYTHAALCMFDMNEFWGIRVNGIGLSRRPRIRKDGEVYESDKDCKPAFARASVRFAPDALEKSYFTVHSYYQNLLADMKKLEQDTPSAPVMTSFPENWSSCGNYGGCPYLPFCRAWSNPLAHSAEPPIEMQQSFWDPRIKEETAKALFTYDTVSNTAQIAPVSYGGAITD